LAPRAVGPRTCTSDVSTTYSVRGSRFSAFLGEETGFGGGSGAALVGVEKPVSCTEMVYGFGGGCGGRPGCDTQFLLSSLLLAPFAFSLGLLLASVLFAFLNKQTINQQYYAYCIFVLYCELVLQ